MMAAEASCYRTLISFFLFGIVFQVKSLEKIVIEISAFSHSITTVVGASVDASTKLLPLH